MQPKASIIMAYHDRFEQLLFTMKTIIQTKWSNYEIIIVDDASNDLSLLRSLIDQFNITIKIIRVEPYDKKWINPCIPNNIGIDFADSDIIILQNPECFYFGDVITELCTKVNDFNYVVCSCLSISKENTYRLHQIENVSYKEIRKKIIPLPVCSFEDSKETAGWSNHPVIKPKGYNFTSAITINNMKKLNGFDERFYNGIAWDDDEFLNRIKKFLSIEIMNVAQPFVVHQWHPSVISYTNDEWKKKYEINSQVYEKCLTNNEIEATRVFNKK